jgi:hypothetical protein
MGSFDEEFNQPGYTKPHMESFTSSGTDSGEEPGEKEIVKSEASIRVTEVSAIEAASMVVNEKSDKLKTRIIGQFIVGMNRQLLGGSVAKQADSASFLLGGQKNQKTTRASDKPDVINASRGSVPQF